MKKSILQRLKPEILEALKKDLVDHPSSTLELLEMLSKTYYINDIKYTYILSLERAYREAFNSYSNNPWECLIEEEVATINQN